MKISCVRCGKQIGHILHGSHIAGSPVQICQECFLHYQNCETIARVTGQGIYRDDNMEERDGHKAEAVGRTLGQGNSVTI
jgi:ribosome-binding protein aMBF1 (putative translation factor)